MTVKLLNRWKHVKRKEREFKEAKKASQPRRLIKYIKSEKGTSKKLCKKLFTKTMEQSVGKASKKKTINARNKINKSGYIIQAPRPKEIKIKTSINTGKKIKFLCQDR